MTNSKGDLTCQRKQLDQINKELCKLFIKRLYILEEILKIKKEQKKEIYDVKRTQTMIDHIKEELKVKNVSEPQRKCILKTFQLLFQNHLEYMLSLDQKSDSSKK